MWEVKGIGNDRLWGGGRNKRQARTGVGHHSRGPSRTKGGTSAHPGGDGNFIGGGREGWECERSSTKRVSYSAKWTGSAKLFFWGTRGREVGPKGGKNH